MRNFLANALAHYDASDWDRQLGKADVPTP